MLKLQGLPVNTKETFPALELKRKRRQVCSGAQWELGTGGQSCLGGTGFTDQCCPMALRRQRRSRGNIVPLPFCLSSPASVGQTHPAKLACLGTGIGSPWASLLGQRRMKEWLPGKGHLEVGKWKIASIGVKSEQVWNLLKTVFLRTSWFSSWDFGLQMA